MLKKYSGSGAVRTNPLEEDMAKKKHTPRRPNPAAEQQEAEKLAGSVTVIPAEPEKDAGLSEPDNAETTVSETEDGQEPAAETPAENQDAAQENAASAEKSAEEEYNFQSLLRDLKKIRGKVQTAAEKYELPNLLLTRFIAVYFILSGFWILYLKYRRFSFSPP